MSRRTAPTAPSYTMVLSTLAAAEQHQLRFAYLVTVDSHPLASTPTNILKKKFDGFVTR